jgi:hypothetical protein
LNEKNLILTTHQPLFIPWPGFFCKALQADLMVLLDNVQFPFGVSWLTRNRLKSDKGELWINVPVWKKGRGKQMIRDVEIFYELDWIKKHLRSIREQYANAPYLNDVYPHIEAISKSRKKNLLELNLELIQFLWTSLGIPSKFELQSNLHASGIGTDLLINVCKMAGADTYRTLLQVKKYLDESKFQNAGIKLEFIHFSPPTYPQLWGEFRQNLSTLDLLLNVGPRSLSILQDACAARV